MPHDLVVSGPLDKMNAAPHINGAMTFRPDGKGGWQSSFTRDGFPWAEAYYHDGKGNVQTIFQDPAVRGNPHDLFAIEPGEWNIFKQGAYRFEKGVQVGPWRIWGNGDPKISRQ